MLVDPSSPSTILSRYLTRHSAQLSELLDCFAYAVSIRTLKTERILYCYRCLKRRSTKRWKRKCRYSHVSGVGLSRLVWHDDITIWITNTKMRHLVIGILIWIKSVHVKAEDIWTFFYFLWGSKGRIMATILTQVWNGLRFESYFSDFSSRLSKIIVPNLNPYVIIITFEFWRNKI